MAEIGVHHADHIGARIQRVAQTVDIGFPQAGFSLPMQDGQASRVSFRQGLGDLAGAVRAVIVHHKDVMVRNLQ